MINIEYNDYKHILVVKTKNDEGQEVSKEIRISQEQVYMILSLNQQDFLNENGWVVAGKNLIEKRTFSINELSKKFAFK